MQKRKVKYDNGFIATENLRSCSNFDWYNNLNNKFKNIIPRGKFHRTKETLERMSEAQLGKKHSEETKEKISKSNIGRISGMQGKHHSEEARKRISLGTMGTHLNEKAGSWKGDKVGDRALHNWVRRRLPKPEARAGGS